MKNKNPYNETKITIQSPELRKVQDFVQIGVHMKIQRLEEEAFKAYGRVLTKEYEVEDLIAAMLKTEAPADDVVYYPSIPELEALPIAEVIKNSLFGGLPMQVGYCNGTNQKLNAVEYHRCSEIGVAVTDLILLIGKQQDIEEDYTYDSGKIEAFYVSAGEIVEMYATTLHYAPCSVDGKPFRNVVILPKGTNTEVENRPEGSREDMLLTAKNKWLIAHEDAGIEGAFAGIKGINITIS